MDRDVGFRGDHLDGLLNLVHDLVDFLEWLAGVQHDVNVDKGIRPRGTDTNLVAALDADNPADCLFNPLIQAARRAVEKGLNVPR